ncbi:dihydroorotate dehydrogenase electron transfer subunit [Camelliibacillus cellulosilyticus]|uniref:Dihydroorotate dehydrogenase B (NAD(+)), electron transfer subunit n=1 Tax=Camelliibacillus cellulosilyticus TaxID=2174486 RepID=A0ABV9GH17_9BACL
MRTEKMRIVEQREIARHIFETRLEGALAAEVKAPGQFVHVRIGDGFDPLLRRPISICDVDADMGTITLIYRAEGAGTRKMASLSANSPLDVLGPLGNGFPIDVCPAGGRALLVGGGIGVPPLYGLAKQLRRHGVQTVHVHGFSDADVVFYEEAFAELGTTFITTVDGSKGTKGFVTDVIEAEALDYDVMYACGPLPMLKALEDQYGDQPLYLSLEQRMGCGIGACFACVCHVKNDPNGTEYRKVCSDGPVFKAGEVVLA